MQSQQTIAIYGWYILRIAAKNETAMHKVKTLWGKWCYVTREIWDMIMYKLLISKLENISVGVTGMISVFLDWKVSEWTM